MRLRELLYSDLRRQYVLEGRSERPANLFGVLARLLHHRFLPLVLYRVARAAKLNGVPGIPELLTYANIVVFGLEISPRCEIGPGLFLPHTSGTVVGAWRLGANVTIFQGVTLGAKGLDLRFERELRPEVGNNVVLGAGCKILGGLIVQNHVTVGANAVLLESVPAGATVVGIPARVIPRSIEGAVACD